MSWPYLSISNPNSQFYSQSKFPILSLLYTIGVFNIQDKRDKKIKSNDISNKNHDNNDDRIGLGVQLVIILLLLLFLHNLLLSKVALS